MRAAIWKKDPIQAREPASLGSIAAEKYVVLNATLSAPARVSPTTNFAIQPLK